ncbi:hypothetical protein [Sphingomonas pollutisoli]|uniref:hypothetical protein n=1 Tax=Sphingomonas TaxID=13687 RepID=UPI0030B836B0
MRTSSAILLPLALAACGERTADTDTLATVEAQQRAAADDDGLIECAPKGAGSFTRACTVDRTESDQGLVLTVRHASGAFHRLLVTKDGRGVVAADGAEPAVVTILGPGRIEVALSGDRYRLPATVKGAAKPS